MEKVKNINVDGIQWAARLAMQPNMYGFCGEDGDQLILRKCATTANFNYEKVRKTLSGHGFPHLNAFLEAIGRATDNDTFSGEVVKSYWLGGSLTEETAIKGRRLLVEQYKQRMGVDFGESVDKILPKKIYLTHLTQVAMIAAADYGELQRGKVINLCMIARASVEEIDMVNKIAIVTRETVEKQNDIYVVTTKRYKEKLDLELTPNLKVGDEVAVHLGYVAGKLTEVEASNLSYWTRKVVELI